MVFSHVIASQLPPRFNDAIRALAPGVEIDPIAPGLNLAPPAGSKVLLLGPFFRTEGVAAAPPPPGWPFDLQWIHLASTGIDSYPAWVFAGPPVTTSKGISSVALAEFSLAAILAHAKFLPELWIDTAAQWQGARPLALVAGATLGLFGFGGIGQTLAPMALALGMRVIALRNTDAPFPVPGVERAPNLEALVREADHLVLGAPLTPATHHIIGRDILRQAKPGLHIVNISRGALIDDDALLEAIDAGIVARATLDTTAPEPLPDGHAFYAHPRVFISPHASVFVPATPERFAAKFVQNLAYFQQGKSLPDRVDPQLGY